MKTALKFLRDHLDVAFATIGNDGKPRLRVFQIMKMSTTDLYFATSPHKEVFQQLKQNPHIEILSMQGNTSVRIAGKVEFDVIPQICLEIYNQNPVLPRLYADYTALIYFRLPISKLDYYDLSTDPPTLKAFNNLS